jgi:hypothetical protein
MRVMKCSFMEFGNFEIARDSYPIAIVYGNYDIVEMSEDEFEEANNFDWIDLDNYKGQIVMAYLEEK